MSAHQTMVHLGSSCHVLPELPTCLLFPCSAFSKTSSPYSPLVISLHTTMSSIGPFPWWALGFASCHKYMSWFLISLFFFGMNFTFVLPCLRSHLLSHAPTGRVLCCLLEVLQFCISNTIVFMYLENISVLVGKYRLHLVLCSVLTNQSRAFPEKSNLSALIYNVCSFVR